MIEWPPSTVETDVYLQLGSHVLAGEVVVSRCIKAKELAQVSQGLRISVSANPILHTTSEMFVVDDHT